MTAPRLYDLWEDGPLRDEDLTLASHYVNVNARADAVIAPDGRPYLYRWHVIPRNTAANVYFHIQVASDPERPLHDHPWDNQSVILSGGYEELVGREVNGEIYSTKFTRVKGQVIQRKATDLHRLILPAVMPYAMTLFTTGPTIRNWGFIDNGVWRPYQDCITDTPDGRSVWKRAEEV